MTYNTEKKSIFGISIDSKYLKKILYYFVKNSNLKKSVHNNGKSRKLFQVKDQNAEKLNLLKVFNESQTLK